MRKKWMQLIEAYAPELLAREENPLSVLLKEDFQEIMLNAWDQVYVETKEGIEKRWGVFQNPQHYEREIALFLAKYNQRLSIDRSILHFAVEGKIRVQVLHRHISDEATIMSFRRSGAGRFSVQDFYESKFMTVSQYILLKKLVSEKKTIFISGETSSGKTTLLNFLLELIPKHERLVVIEDTREIKVSAERNTVYLRTSKAEYQREDISTSDLIKASLRLRPDRIILGEIRREEVVDFLHAINTGHQGSLCTGHGNSPRDMVHRLEMLLMEAGVPYDAAKRYLGRGIDVICHLEGKGRRKIDKICLVEFMRDEVLIREIFEDGRADHDAPDDGNLSRQNTGSVSSSPNFCS